MRSKFWVGVLSFLLVSGCSGVFDVGSTADGGSRPNQVVDASRPPVSVDASVDVPEDDGGIVSEMDSGVDEPSVDSGVVDAGTPVALRVSLFNTVTGSVEPTFDPVPEVLRLVEMPPRVTFAFDAPAEVNSLRYELDNGTAVLDAKRPFRLNKDNQGAPAPWNVKPGKHQLKVAAFASADGTGAALSEVELPFELSSLGMAANLTPVSDGETTKWVNEKLIQSFVPKDFPDGAKSLKYRIFVPPDYSDKVKYPLVVYLHGFGERGNDNRENIIKFSKLFTGQRSLVAPNGRNAFPAIVLVPQCSDIVEQGTDRQEWAHWSGDLGGDGNYNQAPEPSPSAARVLKLIDALKTQYNIDATRIYLTGISMGGFGSWEFTTRWPDVWAASIPMAGYSDKSKASRVTKIPFWVFHHEKDTYNPVAGSRNMTKAVKDAGGNVKYTEYNYIGNPNGNNCYYHCGSFDKAYTEEPDLLPWLFSQRKR
jgi:predicted peptidase